MLSLLPLGVSNSPRRQRSRWGSPSEEEDCQRPTGWEGAALAVEATLASSSRGLTHTGQSLPSVARPVRTGCWRRSPPVGTSAPPPHRATEQSAVQRGHQAGSGLPGPAPTFQPSGSPSTPTGAVPLVPADCSRSRNPRAKGVYLSV